MHEEPSRRRDRSGFSLLEIMIVVAIILILATIATVPHVEQAHMLSRENTAFKTIATIQTAQTQYTTQFGRYAATLQELGPPSGGEQGPAAASLISAELATGAKGGYLFTLARSAMGYTITAVPATYKGTGRRSFYSDQSMTVHENWGSGPASAESPEVR